MIFIGAIRPKGLAPRRESPLRYSLQIYRLIWYYVDYANRHILQKMKIILR
jgi:hypothetical protein